ncbi:hypothetical protein GJ744_010388 [Endocarpon pusillum]|uniref:Uncharacterized protein n=1 Tax=Endocarpon pusillum TaxID=364733 RepID=A0A8H7AI63_9EURO|nr:hypothetical protein GJ744_010388 [Endocarpon pusillum]
MGLNQEMDINALRAATVNFKYLAWLVNNQHLFGPHPSAYMSREVVLNITVQARDSGAITIPEVPVDSALSQSLISTQYAKLTQGTIVETGGGHAVQETGGKTYTLSSYVTLSWWVGNECISSSDNFYITDDLPSNCHAMLHHMPDNGNQGNKALPLYNKFQTAEERKRAEERHKLEEKTHSTKRQAENQKIVDKTKKLTSSSTKQPSK